MMTYAGMGCPEPRWDWLLSHPSKLPNQSWDTVFDRACYHEDDGHMAKMIRCMRHTMRTSKEYDHLPEFRVKQEMFLPAAVAAIDSGSKQPMEWTKHFDFIRGAGYPEAWERIPPRSARTANMTPEEIQAAMVVDHSVVEDRRAARENKKVPAMWTGPWINDDGGMKEREEDIRPEIRPKPQVLRSVPSKGEMNGLVNGVNGVQVSERELHVNGTGRPYVMA